MVQRSVPFPPSLAFLELEYSAQRGGKLFAVVQNDGVAYAGTVDPATAKATPLGPKAYFNCSFPPATGGFFNQFNTISTLSEADGLLFTTAFHYEVPGPPPSDPILYVLGNDLTTGELVYQREVRNPFCEILWLPTTVA